MSFVLVPQCGLCNRLRAMASLNKLMVENDDYGLVVWQKDSGLNANFSDLFELSGARFKVTRMGGIRMRLQRYAFEKDKEFLSQANYTEAVETYNRTKKLWLTTFSNFYNANDYSWLCPVKQIQKKIDSITKYFDGETIGLHIRRTDNADSIEHSPIELFCTQIEREMHKNPNRRFYLATDDEETRNYLMSQYGSNILVNSNPTDARIETGRNSRQGMINAVIDLYCLAAASKIYGSFWSSFSETASDIGGVELIVLKK